MTCRLVPLLLLSGAIADAAPRQQLAGHMLAAAARLQPLSRLPGATRLNLAIALPLRNPGALSNLLTQLYDPASPRFHQYLTPEQFTEAFGPAAADYQAVAAFAQSHGFTITATSPNRVLLDVNAAAADIEQAFHLTLRLYQHPVEGRTFYAPDAEPSLDLAVPILHISGLDNYALPRPASLKRQPSNAAATPLSNTGSGPGGTFLGNDFRSAYAPGVALSGSGQAVGLVEFDGYYASDIAAYASLAKITNPPALQNVLLDGFSGSPDPSFNANDEVSLDIEMAISMAPGLAKVIVYEAGPYGVPNDILNRMATDNQAKQLSSSWFWSPFDPAAEQIFQQFAAQGQSFFQASGDWDAYTGPAYRPSDDVFLTSVGGTVLATSGAGGPYASETVWNWGNGLGSGGGVSSNYALPTWQEGIDMTANQGSTVMRNFPDVAAIADDVWVLYGNGSAGIFGGTSCSAPLWAAFVALANQQGAEIGQPTLGFINPAIYALGKSTNYTAYFHDILTGNNASPSSDYKYFAVTGYDLCTGWGSPTGKGLINALVPPPAPVFRSIVRSGSVLLLTWQALLGETYQLQYRTFMAQSTWTNLGAPINATNSIMTTAQAIGPDPTRFYRLVFLP